MFMIFLSAFCAVAVGNPFSGMFQFSNKEPNKEKLDTTYKDPFSTKFEKHQNILEERRRQEKEEELHKAIQNYMRNGENSASSMIFDKYRNDYGMGNSRHDDRNSFTFHI